MSQMHHSRGLCSHMESHPHSLPRPTVPCVIWPLAVSTVCLFPHSSPASLSFLKHPKLILAQGLCKGFPWPEIPLYHFLVSAQILSSLERLCWLLTPSSRTVFNSILLILIAPTTLRNYFVYFFIFVFYQVIFFLFIFFQIDWDIIDIQHSTSLKCTA